MEFDGAAVLDALQRAQQQVLEEDALDLRHQVLVVVADLDVGEAFGAHHLGHAQHGAELLHAIEGVGPFRLYGGKGEHGVGQGEVAHVTDILATCGR